MMKFNCGGYEFNSDFDSGNLARIDLVNISLQELRNQEDVDFTSKKTKGTRKVRSSYSKDGKRTGNDQKNGIKSAEFNAWTHADCEGTAFQNANRTWFYFSVKSEFPSSLMKMNIINMNKQGKLFNYGMAPVYKVVNAIKSSDSKWSRIPESPTYHTADNQSVLSFIHYLPQETEAVTFFAFTYPFSFNECQDLLCRLDAKFGCDSNSTETKKRIYYHREILCKSLESRRIDLLTISSSSLMLDSVQEDLIDADHMFPDRNRCNKFEESKKIIVISSRVHPGETPASHVFNGFLNFMLSDDERAVKMRDLFVFKLIPILNPDGVVNGHYRTDTRGVNLNRVYRDPNPELHPSIYAVCKLVRYHCHKLLGHNVCKNVSNLDEHNEGIFLYVDLHGHASKRGCFMYGNYFEDVSSKVECMLLPKLMSLTCAQFDFGACNFSERNMYQSDKSDKTSKEGSGRVSVYKMTNLIRCYTLECNYNGSKPGGLATVSCRQSSAKTIKYTPQTYAEVGKAIALSTLDLVSKDSVSRVIHESPYRDVDGIRQWLLKYINNTKSPASFKQLSTPSPSPSGMRIRPPNQNVSKKIIFNNYRSLSLSSQSSVTSSPTQIIKTNMATRRSSLSSDHTNITGKVLRSPGKSTEKISSTSKSPTFVTRSNSLSAKTVIIKGIGKIYSSGKKTVIKCSDLRTQQLSKETVGSLGISTKVVKKRPRKVLRKSKSIRDLKT